VQIMQGLFSLTLGLFMKVVLADSMLSESANDVFAAKNMLQPLDAWMGVLAFSGQIFFDFAGYSTCAIGAALCLGFSLPENFKFPYAAIGFSDFWKRWHITLSAWLRDYLYVPLGGNRHGTFNTYVNLMITMLLGGLWHGASWTFVVWGALHGIYLTVEKGILDIRSRMKAKASANANDLAVPAKGRTLLQGLGLALFTYFLVNVTWVFFRAEDFTGAWRLLTAMFHNAPDAKALLSNLSIIKISTITAGTLIVHWYMRDRSVRSIFENWHWAAFGSIWAALLILLILSQESSSSFIYFQF
jgi:alginate O-acetyltransferase complex protein AlgI